MAKYLIQASYPSEGTKGLLKEGGSGRRNAAAELIKSLGGKLETMYFGFGDHDAFVIAELPDNVAAAAVSLAVNSSGLVNAHTTVLLTPEEMDQAAKKTASYRPPGR